MNISSTLQIEDRFFIFENTNQILYEFNKETYQLIQICKFELKEKVVIKTMLYYKNSILLCPLVGLSIIFYDLKSGTYDIKTNDFDVDLSRMNYYSLHRIYQDRIYFISLKVSCEKSKIHIPYMDLSSYAVKEELFEGSNNVIKEDYIETAYPSSNTTDIYIPDVKHSRIIRLNIINKIYELIQVNKGAVSSACIDEEKLYYIGTNGATLSRLDFKTEEEKVFEFASSTKNAFGYLCNLKDYILALPREGNTIATYRKDAEKIEEFIISAAEGKDVNGSKSVAYVELENKILILPLAMSNFIEIHPETRSIKNAPVWCSWEDYISMLYDGKKLFQENTERTLKSFLEYIEANHNG